MAIFQDKFTEVSTLVSGAYYTQAQDECANGVYMSVEAANDLQTIISKMVDAGIDIEITDALTNFKDHYLG